MFNSVQQNQRGIPLACGAVVALFAIILVIPASREVFRTLSADYPMVMGFVKFALLATVGELLAGRLACGQWTLPAFLAARMLIWGFLGAVLAIMLKLYSGGVIYLLEEGFLPGGGSLMAKAAATSILMNITFGPVMMAFHKMTDKYLLLREKGSLWTSADPQWETTSAGALAVNRVAQLSMEVDWRGFCTFVLLKTVPFFWFPAHTITFMLPAEYQTIMAAFLSMALGVLLSIRRD